MAVFGVDLGTLNSVVAVTRHGGIDIVCNEVSKRETATFVSYFENERLIGESGLDKAVRNWKNTVPCVKRLIGLRRGDARIESELRFVHCDTTFDAEGRLQLEVDYNGNTIALYPEQVLAAFLGKLKKYVAAETKIDSKDVVVTVPVWYTIEQRKHVMQACEFANLNCLSLINETTASSVDYGIFRQSSLSEKEEEAATVAIVDLGYAGTTITVSKFWKGNMRVMAHVWDHELGTREVEWLLASFFATEIKKKYNVDVTQNKRAMIRILQGCDKLKCMLSANVQAPLNIENLMDVDVNIMYTREQLEAVVQPLCEKLRKLSALALARSGVSSTEQLAAVEVIGGGSRIPIFKTALHEAFGVLPGFTLNASESVARGAAITAATFSPLFQVREYIVNEAPLCPLLLGYQSSKTEATSAIPWLPGVNKTMSILKEGDRYPKTIDLTFQRSDEFDLWAFYDENAENAQFVPKEHRSLVGHWRIGGPGGKPTNGSVKVRVRFHASGLVSIDSATTHETYETEVEVPVKPVTDGDGANNNNTQPKEGGEKQGTAEQEATPDAPPQKQLVKKQMQRKLDLTVTPQLFLGLPADALAKAKLLEAESDSRDHTIQKTREARNELEAYVYDYRPRIEDGSLTPFVTAGDRATFVSQANDVEAWFTGEASDDASHQDYQTRLERLKVIGAAALRRQRLSEEIPFAHAVFEKKVTALKEKSEGARKIEHLTAEEIDGVVAKCEEALSWGAKELKEYQSKPQPTDPTISPATFELKSKEIEAAVNALVTKKPPPPPKKEEVKKGDSPTPGGAKGEGASPQNSEGTQPAAAENPPAAGPGTVPVELD